MQAIKEDLQQNQPVKGSNSQSKILFSAFNCIDGCSSATSKCIKSH